MANLTGMLFKRYIDTGTGPGEFPAPEPAPAPTYSVTPAASNVNEGSSLTFNVTGTNIVDGTYYWTVTNSGDFITSSGSFVISSGAGSFSGAFSVTPTADVTTEGAETFTASVRTGSVSGTIVATSSTVTINDTSTAPAPTYTVTPVTSTVNEGSSLAFNVAGTNIFNGTYYWTVTNSGDFGTSSGSFIITSNTGSFSVTPAGDATTEGAETFTSSVRTGSTSGTVVATSSTVTINDTSTAPAPSPVLEGAGALWNWGSNFNGELGDNTQIAKSSPVQTVSSETNWKQISGGLRQSFAIKTDGTLWAWGLNNYGQFGDNSTTSRSSPVQTGNGETTWAQISAGRGHSVAIKIDGTIWGWGQNVSGQLGRSSPAQTSVAAQVIGGGTTWKQCASGMYHTAAIKTDGTLWTWGLNNGGQLGDNTTTNRSSPVQTISAGTNWKYVSAGGGMAAAIKTDGTLWTWGRNADGDLGDGTRSPRSSPVQTVAGGTNWNLVSCGWYNTAAIKTDGTLWSWGRNAEGQLGDNTSIGKSSPVQIVTGGTNWKQAAVGYQHVIAIKTDGTLWLWGQNASGQLGNNTTVKISSPVQTVAGGSNWKQVASGGHHVLAIRE